jgi:hypothetical protein
MPSPVARLSGDNTMLLPGSGRPGTAPGRSGRRAGPEPLKN